MIGKILNAAVVAVVVATTIHAYRERKTHGDFHSIPFDFRAPTIDRVRERLWNPDDSRVLTPPVFGVGWSINLYQAARDMGLIDAAESESESPSEGRT